MNDRPGRARIAPRAPANGVLAASPPKTARNQFQYSVCQWRQPLGACRVRRSGGGRKSRIVMDSTLLEDLQRLVEPTSRGDPESPLRWTCKSVRKLAEELKAQGHQTSHRMVAELLHDLGYSLQANQK